jgi:Flp pilus assembly protein TadD
MRENILYSIAGIVLGFFIGFFIANLSGSPHPGASITNGTPDNPARSTGQAQAGGQLPPGHPDINGADANTGNAASTSAQAQAAMDEADRNPQDFAAQIRAAATFFQLGSYDKATLYLNRSLALKPNDPDALTGMGQTKYETGDYTGAANFFEKVLAQHPNDADLRTDLGNTYAKRSPPDYARAITEYRKALAVDPKNEQALEKLAEAALRKGDKATAHDAIDKLAVVNPSNPALSSLRSKLDTK